GKVEQCGHCSRDGAGGENKPLCLPMVRDAAGKWCRHKAHGGSRSKDESYLFGWKTTRLDESRQVGRSHAEGSVEEGIEDNKAQQRRRSCRPALARRSCHDQ